MNRAAEHAVMCAIEAGASDEHLRDLAAGLGVEIWACDWVPRSIHRPTLFPSFIEARAWLADQAACRFNPEAGERIRQQTGACELEVNGSVLWIKPYEGNNRWR